MFNINLMNELEIIHSIVDTYLESHLESIFSSELDFNVYSTKAEMVSQCLNTKL